MPEKSFSFKDLILIDEVSKVKTVNDQLYKPLIPREMRFDFLNQVYFDIFGVKATEIFLSRFIFDAKTVLITDFSENGFFWAQLENEEMVEYTKLYERINEEEFTNKLKTALPEHKKCLAKYLEEWFRAYIIDVSDSQYELFFIDYGTVAYVNKSETRFNDDEKIWSLAPMAIPFILRDFEPSKAENLKEHQYNSFNIKSIKLIHNNVIFEVELNDENGKNLLEIV